MNETRTIFFVGKPGSGKGTQAKMLAKKTGWRIITAGDQFRAMAAEDTPVGHRVKVENDAGMLQPHWLAMYLFLKSLFTVGADENIIFDGFNRKVMEAELTTDSLKWLGRPFTVLNIVVSDEEVEKRLALRKGIEGRADDNVVDERLKEYHEYTEPAIEVFRKAGELIEIDGMPSPGEIVLEVNTVLNIK
jgi:adenylate kinase